MATATGERPSAAGTGERPGGAGFRSDELGALAHLYRGEVYRSTLWRTRLDHTTNWAVVTTGLALSLTFATPEASPLPLILVGLLVVVFLIFEARRYRYFNVWRARCRLMETDLYAPLLRGEGVRPDGRWNTLLAGDYERPRFHISQTRAIGRRLRKNYAYILSVQAVAYYGKLAIHPDAAVSWGAIFERAAIGPIPGQLVVVAGLVFHAGWIGLAAATLRIEKRYRKTDLIAIA
jgi:uncharacterized membrane protein